MINEKYIRFDWAVKRMLRDKANFAVLEGLMTVLIGEQVKIVEILESEGNQNASDDKFNRVDVMARNSKGEYIIVEVQLSREVHFLEHMLYGVSKVVTDNIRLGEMYDKVKKVYSINILYFSLGQGKDFVYHGTTHFIGLHTGDELSITNHEVEALGMRTPKEIFQEYYIIRINEFNDVARTPLEEWIDYLKNGNVRSDTTAPGLQEVRSKLQYLTLDDKERRAYERHLEDQMIQNDVMGTARLEGRTEGRAEGIAEGRVEGRAEGIAEGIEAGRKEERIALAKSMKADGMPVSVIEKYTSLTAEEISKL
jgi:predicted transposase/invertase (TIGR01784 family)